MQSRAWAARGALLCLCSVWWGCPEQTPADSVDMSDMTTSQDLGQDMASPPDQGQDQGAVTVDMEPQGMLRLEGDGELLKVDDFGRPKTQVLTLVNETPRAVVLGSVTLQERQEDRLAEFSFVESPQSQAIEPGASAKVELRYQPLNATDDSAQVTFLVTDQGKMNLLSAFVFGRYTPGPELNYPERMDLGPVEQGQTKRIIIPIFNNTDSPQQLRDAYLTPQDAGYSFKVANSSALDDPSRDAAFAAGLEIPSKETRWLSVSYEGQGTPTQALLIFVSTVGTREIKLVAL